MGRIFSWQGTAIVLATLTVAGLAVFFQMGSAAQPVGQQSPPPAAQEPKKEATVQGRDLIARVIHATDGTIPLTAGEAAILQLKKPVRTVVVGDPTIIEARVQDEKTVILTAKARGKTDLFMLDDKNNPIFSAKIDADVPVDLTLVKVHTRPGRRGELQSSWGFSCPSRGLCTLVKDDPITIDQQARLTAAQNLGVGGPLVQQNIEPQQTNTPAPAPAPSSTQTNTSE
jgi:hypothetical protein